MNKPLFGGYEVIANHGTAQGIIPRFFLQINDLANIAIGKDGEDRCYTFLEKNVTDFTDVYDIYQKFLSQYSDYINGINSGKYFKLTNDGFPSIDRSVEIEMRKTVKDFFIYCKLAIDNFSKSGLIDDDKFQISKYLFVNDKNYEKNKELCLSIKDGPKYDILFSIVDGGRNKVLSQLSKIRNDYEHYNFQVGNFVINVVSGKIEIVEPDISNMSLKKSIDFFYEEAFNFIESLIVFYWGLNAYHKSGGALMLFQRRDFDFSQMKYRFVIYPRIFSSGLDQLIFP